MNSASYAKIFQSSSSGVKPPPAPAADPFTGSPFHYRREGNGFVAYSGGLTMQEDSGTRSALHWTKSDLMVPYSCPYCA